MVYGFVKQSGGHLRIYSEVAQGTTINLYLPRYFGDKKEVTPGEAGHGATPREAFPDGPLS
jgi:hypothetical protein